MKYRHLHIAMAMIWMTVALGLGIKTAILGNEQAALARQRGSDLKERTDLAYQGERLRSAIAWASSPPVLAEAVRRLDLPLRPPVTMAVSPQSTPPPRTP
jgi:hypothetical protein